MGDLLPILGEVEGLVNSHVISMAEVHFIFERVFIFQKDSE